MTRERRIALKMWEYIRDQISLDLLSTRDRMMLHEIKRRWLRKYCPELLEKWWATCWFCQYFQQEFDSNENSPSLSYKCPLNDNQDDLCKGHCILYHTVVSSNSTKELRLEACDKIIEALKGKAGFGYSKGSHKGKWKERINNKEQDK